MDSLRTALKGITLNNSRIQKMASSVPVIHTLYEYIFSIPNPPAMSGPSFPAHLLDSYVNPFFDLVERAPEVYPGWKIRLYTNIVGKSEERVRAANLLAAKNAKFRVLKMPDTKLNRALHNPKLF